MSESPEALEAPEAPTDSESLVGEESVPPRYEDISQDGRLRLEGIWHPTGRLLWSGHPLGGQVLRWGREHGVRTVLSRVVLEAADERVGPRIPARTTLRYRFEHSRDEHGAVRRLHFSTWLRTEAPSVVGAGAFETEAGPARLVARAYGQRTFARLDAPPGKRSVTELPGMPELPPDESPWVAAGALLEVPAGATPLDDRSHVSPVRVVFGLSHTDANQHVNFLAYPRYLEQAALGHLDDLGEGAAWMARRTELVYRRPSHAGETIAVVLRAFRLGAQVGVCAAFVDASDAERAAREGPGRLVARCTARMLLSR